MAKETRTKAVAFSPVECFVLMPFKPDLDEVYSKALVPGVCAVPGVRCSRADEIYGPRPIMADVWQSIQSSHFVVADLTSRNPNVLYELGLSHAIQKPVILLAQDIDDIPFDLKHVRVILYSNTAQGRAKLRAEIQKHVHVLAKEIGSRTAHRKYIVLEQVGEENIPLPKNTARLLKDLKSKDPGKVIEVLEKIEQEYEFGKRWKDYDPAVVNQIRNLVNSELPEIQVAAIRALGRAGTRVHASSLYRFLTCDNPTLMETSIASLGHLRDSYATQRLIAMAKDGTCEPCIDILLDALGRIGSRTGIDFLRSMILDPQEHPTVRCAAVKGLAVSLDADEALLSVDTEKLGPQERRELVRGLAHMQSAYTADRREKLQGQIMRLVKDGDPLVRGSALAAWCLQSFEDFDGQLDRAQFLTCLSESDQASLAACMEDLEEYETPFAPSEGPLLTTLCRKYPVILDHVVTVLREIGDSSVAEFMLTASEASDTNSLWTLDFFCRNPSPIAAEMQKQVISHEKDPSCVCLAAVGLLRSGQEDASKTLLVHAKSAYDWVKSIVRDCLSERLEKETSTRIRRSIHELLKKLPRTGAG